MVLPPGNKSWSSALQAIRNADTVSTVIAFAIVIFFIYFLFYRISLRDNTDRAASQVKRNQNTVPPLAMPFVSPEGFVLAAERRASLKTELCSITASMP